ncbi:response regulator [Marinifilum fragile]|uniref:response regulator n=1 Tax=Marinifilum fragile TaxID=570161 RepID=UPI002AA619CB|nr:response regulator [Marinifilum fragile]
MAKASPHILVVDDDVVVLKFIEFTLKGLSYKTTLAKNGIEAIDKAKTEHFDLIISDLYMPLMDGNELVRHFRNTPEYKHTPFIFLSGNNEEETWIKNLNDGADDFITKPIKQKVFISKINSHLKKAFLRKEIIAGKEKSDISYEKGTIIYCANRTRPFPIPHKLVKTNIKVVYTDSDFFMALQGANNWGIIIDDAATWAMSILEKIIEITSAHVPLSLLITDPENSEKMDQFLKLNISTFLYKNLDPKLIVHQINSNIQREHELKNKYLNALNTAAKRSPIRFENEFSDQLNDFQIRILHEPYDKLPGGDYYEIINVDEYRKILVLGDVMGKKWDAWFFVPAYIAYIRSTINFFLNRQEFDFVESPGKFLDIINQYIFKDMQLTEVFTTLSVISICTKQNKISVASAGALRPYYYNKSEDTISQLNIVGTLLGVIKTTKYQSLVHDFNKGDKVLFYTDGYTEAINDKNNEMIGDDALFHSLNKFKLDSDLQPQSIEEELTKAYNVSKFDDDRTLLLVQRN